MNNETFLYRSTQIIWYIFYALEALLLLRFALKLLGANPGAMFTNLIYSISDVFITPFQFVFGPSTSGQVFIEWNTLLALAIYWILAWGVVKLLVMGRDVSPREANARLHQQENV